VYQHGEKYRKIGIPNVHKIYKMGAKYVDHMSFKCTNTFDRMIKIAIFGLKILYHLATLLSRSVDRKRCVQEKYDFFANFLLRFGIFILLLHGFSNKTFNLIHLMISIIAFSSGSFLIQSRNLEFCLRKSEQGDQTWQKYDTSAKFRRLAEIACSWLYYSRS
jgi:hypothetical protein